MSTRLIRFIYLVVCLLIVFFVTLSATAAPRDLETCEWDPGSNRSTVSFHDAVRRIGLPADVERALLAKTLSDFDAHVAIGWLGIKTLWSEPADLQFGPDIQRMNFGHDGRICKVVTRRKWTEDHVENAIVFVVGDRALGWAAICGNFFEIPFLGRAYSAREKLMGTLEPIEGLFLESGSQIDSGRTAGSSTTAGLIVASAGSWTAAGGYYGGGFSGGGGGGGFGGGGGPCCYCPPIDEPGQPPLVTTPIPEPETYALILAGLALIALRKRTS